MSGLEVIAVLGCVAALVSTFADGEDIVRNIKKRREKQRALQNSSTRDAETDLESTLTTGATTVQRRFDGFHDRLGDRYAQGDQEARDQLKDIIILLQGQVITNLKRIWQQEDVRVDFLVLQDVAEISHHKAILCLIDLHKRMLVAAPIQTTDVLSSLPRQGFVEPESPPTSRGSTESSVPSRPFVDRYRSNSPTREPEKSKYRLGRRIDSLLPRRWLIDARETRTPPIPIAPNEKNTRSISDTMVHSRAWSPTNTRSPSAGSDALGTSLLEHNPWTDDEPSVSDSLPMPHRSSTSSVFSTTPTSPVQQRGSGSMSMSRTSTSTSTNARSLLPGEQNNYRGLCKSAFRMQTHHQKQALEARAVPASQFGTLTRWYWKCTECRFEGKLLKDAKGGHALDSTVHSVAGINYRWSFLFRSHFPRASGKEPKYGCVFCYGITPDWKPLEVFQSSGELLRHIGKDHVGSGRWPEGEILYSMNCAIEGSNAGVDGEGWDIRLAGDSEN